MHSVHRDVSNTEAEHASVCAQRTLVERKTGHLKNSNIIQKKYAEESLITRHLDSQAVLPASPDERRCRPVIKSDPNMLRTIRWFSNQTSSCKYIEEF